MSENILVVIQAILLGLISIITPYIVKFIAQKSEQVKASIKNDAASAAISEIMLAVSSAVAATNQTYVDALKKTNMFTVDAQKEALQKSINTAIASLSNSAKEYIERTVGTSMTEYLTPLIESAVRSDKGV